MNEVVDVEAKRQGGRQRGDGGIRGVDDVSAEETWIIHILLESNAGKDFLYYAVPMLWAMSQVYKVRFSNQYSFFFAAGSLIGGLTIVISSGGRTPWQKAFLQLPCFSVRHC